MSDTVGILIVEDDERLNREIASFLDDNGFQTYSALLGEQALQLLAKKPQLVLLDLDLPDINGEAVCKAIKSQGDTPVIVLTGQDDDISKINMLELGADNYLVKPVPADVLLSYVNATLRLSQKSNVEKVSTSSQEFHFNEFKLNITYKTLAKNDQYIQLTTAEHLLLKALLTKPHHVLSRDQLISLTNEYSEAFDRSIDILISRLRKKIEEDSKNPKIIKTVRGIGYVLDTDVYKKTVNED